MGNGTTGAFTFNNAHSGAVILLDNTAGGASCALSISNNNIQGISYSATSTGSNSYIANTGGTLSRNINNNRFNNLNVNISGGVTFISDNVILPASGVRNVNNNSVITAFNKGAAGGTVTFYTNATSSGAGSSTNINGNNFSNVTVTGATAITGISNTDAGASASTTIQNDTLTAWSGAGSAITGMSLNTTGTNSTTANIIATLSGSAAITGIATAAGNDNIYSNRINTLASSGAAVAVNGIAITAGTTKSVYKNKIYDLSNSNATGTVAGVAISGGTTVNLYNNLIGDLRTPTGNAADPVRGISITSAVASSTIKVYNNTIYINASSSGTNFGTTGILHTTSATATTAALDMRNNIVYNTSTPNGTGLIAAYRRNTTTLTNFASTSDYNLFYAGTPGATKLIFYDGTNSDQTIAAYKTRVSTREAHSVTEDLTTLSKFLSTTGSSANFLHLDPAIATYVESGGATVAGVTDDYDGDIRGGTPDIGADEFSGTNVSITGTAGSCVGATSTLTGNPSGGTWTSSNTSIATAGSSSGIITGVASGTSTITYTVSGIFATVTYTVGVAPSSSGATSTGPICAGGSVTLNSNSTGADTWAWTGPSGYTSSLQNPTASPTVTSTYSLTVSSSGGGCSNATVYTVTVTVNSAPTSSGPTNDGPICSGGTVNLTANTTGATTWSWTGPSGFSSALQNPTASPIVTSTYSLTVTGGAGSGCSPATVYTTTVTVNGAPSSSGPGNDGPICVGGTVNLSANSTGATSWAWSGPSGYTSTLQNPTATPTSTATYSLTVTSTGSGCSPSTVYTTTVTVNSVPSSSGPTNDGPICAGATVNFLANSTGATSWSWTGPSGFTSALQNPSATPTVTSTYSLTVSSAGSGCSPATIYTTTVTVNPVPTSSGPTNDGPICSGGTVNFLANTTGATSWSWTGPSGFSSALQNPSATPTSTGTYSLTVSRTGTGCSPATIYTTTVTVNSTPTSSGPTNNGPICAGATVNLTANSTGATGWSWAGPGGYSSALQNPTATPTVTTTYSLTVSSSGSGCSPSTVYTTTVTVNSTPTSSGPTNDGPICNGGTVNFSANSTAATSWSWTGPSGFSSALQNPTATPTVTGTYSLTVSRTGIGCSPSTVYTTSVTVNSTPSSSGPTNNGPICAGGTVNFTANSTGATSWSWTGPSGFTSTLQNPSATPTVTGTYSLTVSAGPASGCSPGTVYTTTVTVNAGTAAISGAAAVCIGSTTTLTDPPGTGTWTSASTGVATIGASSGIVSGVSSGTTIITYTASPACFTTTVLTVYTAPSAIDGSIEVCIGFRTQLSDLLPGGTWSSTDTTIAKVNAVTGIVTGISAGYVDISYTTPCGDVSTPFGVNPSYSPPVISSLSVSSGYPASTVTLTGGNFNTATYNNLVYFGATKATVTTASPSSLDVVVPIGATYMPVTVENNGCGLVGYSQFPYLPYYDNSAFVSGTINFDPITNFTTGAGPYHVLIKDIDGDGKADIVTTNVTANTVSVFRNTGSSGAITSSSFAAKVDFATGSSPYTVAAEDMDGDGKPDLIVANEVSNSVSVLRSRAVSGTINSGSFAAKVDFTTGTNPISMAVYDVDMDGKPEIITANYFSNTISVLRNTATVDTITSSSFATKVDFATASHPYSLAVGDIDGDAQKEIVVANQGANSVSIFRNTASYGLINSGSFATKVDFTTGTQPVSVALGDIDGDGMLDVAVANTISRTMSVFRNTASYGAITSGSLASKVDFIGGVLPFNIAMSDIDGDGKLDVVMTNQGNTRAGTTAVSVYRNTASSGSITSGSLATKIDFVMSSSPKFVAVGDLDGDQEPDMVVAITGEDKVSVLRYNSIPPITGTTSLCGSGSTTTLADAATGGTWTSSNTSVATVVSGSGLVTSVGGGTTTITYTVAAGNFVTTTFTVTSTPAAITGTTSMCVGASTTLSDATTGGTWTSSNTSVATVVSGTGVVTGVYSGTATITYTVGVGCNALTTVTVLPTAITGPSAVCVGQVATVVDAGGGAWASSNTSVATINASTGDVTGVLAGTTLISYTLSGCTTTRSFTVANAPGSISGTTILCSGSTTTLTDGGGGTWSSSNTGVATMGLTTGVVYGVSSGTAVITYSLGVSCNAITTVTVIAAPASVIGTMSLCTGNTTTLSDATPGGTWISSNTSVATAGSASGVVGGVSAGTAVITYYIGSGCAAIATMTVNTSPATITGSSSVCETAITNLADATGSGNWTTSNSSVATVDAFSGDVGGVASGTVTISYTVPSGCYAAHTMTVNPQPSAITGTTDVCVDGTTNLSDAGGGEWTSSDYSIASVGSTTGLVTGITPGAVDITYTLGTGCFVIANVNVNPLPSAIAGATDVCVGANTALFGDFGGAWSSSDNAVASIDPSSGVVTGIASGTVTITFTAGTGCYVTFGMTVDPLPTTVTGRLAVCVGDTALLSSTPSGGDWSSSDLGIATVDVASGIVYTVAAGTATIYYTLPSTCAAMAAFTVNPTPSSISGANTVCENATITLTDGGGGSWTSSNTSVATVDVSSGVVSGVLAGTTVITYGFGSGCYVTTNITVASSPASITGSSTSCAGATNVLSDATPGGSWTSSNTSVANIGSLTGVVTGITSGTSVISYNLPSGCLSTTVITVNPAPSAISGTASVCEGSTTTLSDAGGGTWLSGSTSVATIGAGTGVVSGVLGGTSTITYTLATGCSTTTVVTVNPTPSGITGSSTVCASSTTTLSDGFSGGTWTSSNTSVATIDPSSGVVTGVVSGTTSITYTLSTGCYTSRAITVISLPAAIAGNTIICTGLTTALSNTTTGGTWSSSNTAVATVGITSGVVTGASIGTTVISYTVTCGIVTTTITVNGAAAGAPTVTSVSPLAGNPAAAVTITGTNFNTSAPNNIVYFGATRATVSAASATSLSVTVPSGATYMPVSVENNGCLLTGYSQYPFLPTFNNSAFVSGTVNFATKVDFSTASNPYSVVIGDIDGDGKSDMVAVNLSANSVSVYRNTSSSGTITSGSFAAKVDFTTGNSPYAAALGDIDGDGKLDLVVSNNASNTISVFSNTATSGVINSGSFATKVDFTTGTNPNDVAIGDIDMDGKPDLVVANFYSNTISVLRNTATSGISSGSFATKVDFTAPSHPYSVAIGDLDGDGKPDVAIANQGAASVSVYRNTSTSGTITTSSLATNVDFTVGTSPFSVAIGDLDGDGKMDLAVANNSSNSISVLRNTSSVGSITSGSFATAVSFTTGSSPYSISLGDIDGDGKVDMVTPNASANTVSVFRNIATSGSITSGSFAAKADFATGSSPRFVAIGDLDNDDKPDMAVANLVANTISVLRNNPMSPLTGSYCNMFWFYNHHQQQHFGWYMDQ